MKGWDVFYERIQRDGEAVYHLGEDSIRVLSAKGDISRAKAIKRAKECFEAEYFIGEIGRNPFEMEIISVERVEKL